MLFFHLEDVFDNPSGGGVVVLEPSDDFGVGFDGDPFRDQVFANHVDEGVPLMVFCMTAGGEAFRIEIGDAAELGDSLRNPICVGLFFVGVLEEFLGDRLGVDAARHEIVVSIAEHADDFGGEDFIEHGDDALAVSEVGPGDGALGHMLSGAFSDGFEVGLEGFFHGKGLWLVGVVEAYFFDDGEDVFHV